MVSTSNVNPSNGIGGKRFVFCVAPDSAFLPQQIQRVPGALKRTHAYMCARKLSALNRNVRASAHVETIARMAFTCHDSNVPSTKKTIHVFPCLTIFFCYLSHEVTSSDL